MDNIKVVFRAVIEFVQQTFRRSNLKTAEKPASVSVPPASPSEPVQVQEVKKMEPKIFNPGLLITDDEFLKTPEDFDIQGFLVSYGSCLATMKYKHEDGTEQAIADIIKEASQYVSARVILTQLEKEQSLVRAKNPSQKALDWAMGFGYEDMGDIKVYLKGIRNQILKGAQSMKHRFDSEAEKYIGKDISTAFPAPWRVGDGSVVPENKATVALYIYTPFIGWRDARINNQYTMKAPFGNKVFWDIWQKFFPA
jgi:hypothetical protein